VGELWRKGFVVKISFETGVERDGVIYDDNGDEGNGELVCVGESDDSISSNNDYEAILLPSYTFLSRKLHRLRLLLGAYSYCRTPSVRSHRIITIRTKDKDHSRNEEFEFRGRRPSHLE